MKQWAILAILLTVTLSLAQVTDTTVTLQQQKTSQAAPQPSRVFFGGSFGFTFINYLSLRIMPLIGYHITPALTGGIKLGYEYFRDKQEHRTITSHNYGGSVFAQFHFIPQAYVHGEFAYINYDEYFIHNSHVRDWVPFLLVGGGFRQKVGKTSVAFLEVLFDVLQSDKSPYKAWDPRISFGVSTGF